MNEKEILDFELSQFQKKYKNTINFKELNKLNTQKALSKALNDALAMAVKRFKTTYKGIEKDLLDCFVDDYLSFATSNSQLSKKDFADYFDKLTKKFENEMNKLNRKDFATFGFAQKFVSMSFKYMYCFNDTKRENFKYCKLPLDKYTINWYRKCGNPELVKNFNQIKFSWSNIDKELYNKIQNNIDTLLQKHCEYKIKCNTEEKIILPDNKIEVEFIVWSQEKLNEVFRKIKQYANYFDRLGIEYKKH